MIDIRHIRYFKTVAEELNFHRAAEKLHVSQPPLSMQIKQLEGFLGTPLFTRTSRKVALTKAGEHFYKKSIQLLKDMENMARETRLIGAGKSGAVRVGFVSSSAAGVFQKALHSFSAEYPDVVVDIRQLTNSEILHAFENDRLDIGFCRLPLTVPDGIEMRMLLKEDYLLAFPKNLKGKSIKNILSRPLVIFPREKAPEMYDDIMRIFRHYEVAPEILFEASEQLTLLGMVSTGLGIAVVPRSACRVNLPGVATLPFPDIRLHSSLALLSRKDKPAVARNFVENTMKNKKAFGAGTA